ncbi:MAG: hypothetical protein ACLP9L_40730, partial [Thermoguttaceae bacterium]
ISSEKISGTSAWQKIRLGPVSPPAGASSMLVGLNVEPPGEVQDLRGTASFGSLWLGQLPRLVLTAQPVREMPPEQEKPGRNRTDGKPVPRRSANDATFLLFPRGQPIEIACLVSGFAVPAYEVRMQLFDSDGHMLTEKRKNFNTAAPAAKPSSSRPLAGEGQGPRETGLETASKIEKQQASPFARMTWRLPGDALGFYRVRATVAPVAPSVPSSSPVAETTPEAELSLAVIEPQLPRLGCEFGWSLSANDAVVGLVPLSDLLGQSGIRWVKFPFAIQEAAVPPAGAGSQGKSVSPTRRDEKLLQQPDRVSKKASSGPSLETTSKPEESAANSLERLISFSDRLGMAGVRLVGVLQPPRAAGDAAQTAVDLLAAEAFARDTKAWFPSIEPVLARLATEIRFWQIGNDHDPGWIGCRDLVGIVSRTKAALDQIGQDLDTGIAWNLSSPLPLAPSPSLHADRSIKSKTLPITVAGSDRQKTPWRFLSFSCDEAIANDALARRLDSTKSAGVARWIVIETLPREGHSARERIAHLVDRMLMAKMHGADAIFVSGPLDPDRGLVDRNGVPSELFLPWRTTALLLGGAPYLGDIDLPQGNQIHCFGGNEKYVGVFAGRKPGQETVYLGNDLRTHDLWGNSRACPPTISPDDAPTGLSPTPRSVIAVQQQPAFLVGLDGPITLWHLGVDFSPNRLPSVPSAMVPVMLELKNTFPQPITGRINIRGPQNWYIEPRTAEFRLNRGARWKQDLAVALPSDVVGGRQMVRLDFEIQADRLYRFAMVRPLEVTLGNVIFVGQAVLNDHGEMEVRQTLTNQGKQPAGFRCDLLVPDRRRQSTDVLIQPSGKSELTYRLPDGEQLRGKTIWLRAEEIDGPRVLNYRIETPAVAVPPTTPQERSNRRQPSPPGANLLL